ncbi:hypothetical protein [Alicyclobacillus pomorum]|jgi:hypothetical protein|uniref:hypothetical protein n=1 Tax=Alicyclobacillus pomorum TaxID=204470 RepID=UPI0003FB5933|nr:hypothetical protein [Alicyclobacillus pomorum]
MTRVQHPVCHNCQEPISSRADLSTAFVGVHLATFHKQCVRQLPVQKAWSLLGGTPLNTAATNWAVVLLPLASVLFLVTRGAGNWVYFFVVSLIPAILRFYAWLRYERHLPRS